MTFLGLTLQQVAIIFGAAGAGVIVLYILKLRRRRAVIPFASLWDQVLSEKESTSLLHRLKRLLSLLLQLLFLFLITAALGDPRLSAGILQSRQILLLVDASASMKATDGEQGTRLAAALDKAQAMIRGKGSADQVMVVRMGRQVTPLCPFISDEKELLEKVAGIRASDTGADLFRALQFSADALRGRQNPLLVLISDGAHPTEVLNAVSFNKKKDAASKKGAISSASTEKVLMSGIEVRHIGVGLTGDNVGIVAFNARRYPRNKLSFEMFLEVINNRPRQSEVNLQLLVDGELIEVQRLRLEAGQGHRYTCDPGDKQRSWCSLAASGELLEARLAPPGGAEGARLDAFPRDDRAFSLLPRRRKQKVLVVTKGNFYLEGAVLLDESLEVSRVKPEEYSPALAAKADAVIFDRHTPREMPPRNYLIIVPPEEGGPFATAGVVQAPLITGQHRSHPVMRWVTLKDVNISRSLRFVRAKGVEVLASSFRDPLIVARDDGRQKSVAFGFDLTRSDLPLRVAFPLLIINSLDWFAGGGKEQATSFRTGETWTISLAALSQGPGATEAVVVGPDRQRQAVPISRAGLITISGEQAGVYTIHTGPTQTRIAANLADAQESQIKPQRPLVMGGRRLQAPGGFDASMKREIWLYLLLAALGLSLVEWLTYNRRMTV